MKRTASPGDGSDDAWALVAPSVPCLQRPPVGVPSARGLSCPAQGQVFFSVVNGGANDEGTQVKGVRRLARQRHRLLQYVHCRSGCASARRRRTGLGGAARQRQRRGRRAETG